MLDAGSLDPVAARQLLAPSRVGARQTPDDQFRHCARERTGLLLDIDDPKCALALGLPPKPVLKPGVDDLQTSQWITTRGVPAVEPVEDIKLVGWPGCFGNDIDRRHAASGMRSENEAVCRECPRLAAQDRSHGAGEASQTVIHEPVDAARQQGWEIV